LVNRLVVWMVAKTEQRHWNNFHTNFRSPTRKGGYLRRRLHEHTNVIYCKNLVATARAAVIPGCP